VLLGRAHWEDDPVVLPQVRLELHPVEIADPHHSSLPPGAGPSRRLGTFFWRPFRASLVGLVLLILVSVILLSYSLK
jgi:hypothetical protein